MACKFLVYARDRGTAAPPCRPRSCVPLEGKRPYVPSPCPPLLLLFLSRQPAASLTSIGPTPSHTPPTSPPLQSLKTTSPTASHPMTTRPAHGEAAGGSQRGNQAIEGGGVEQNRGIPGATGERSGAAHHERSLPPSHSIFFLLFAHPFLFLLN